MIRFFSDSYKAPNLLRMMAGRYYFYDRINGLVRSDGTSGGLFSHSIKPSGGTSLVYRRRKSGYMRNYSAIHTDSREIVYQLY
ncbi:unnamed protein product [Protopolystoma xenopodis]|uniref:Uncharacterized protein n=1 Tax=Protopolystoma xenopodis TaxID=117903 RepID=A0A3S5A7K9_9PLAT|nr:unnamed protein product [Protopolystoma xenopodis]